jgi:hypothetical protein
MKNGFIYCVILTLSFSILSLSCSSSDDDSQIPNDNAVVIAGITASVQTGTWRITNYVDSGQNETNDFTGYTFTFGSDGVITATNGTDTISGTWSVTDSSNSTDDSNDDIDFNILFPVPDTNVFNDLNDDWDLVIYTSTKIELIDISGGNGGTDNLTFEMN